MKKYAVVPLLSALVAMSVFAAAQDPRAKLLNKPVPKFSMKTLEGKTITNASIKGKVVMIDFWATWCGPCKIAAPTVQKMHEKYGKKGVVVIGANSFEQGNSKALAAAYRKEKNYTYTFTYANDKLAESWGINGIPCFVFIDKKGIVRRVDTGFDPAMEKQFDATLAKLIASK